MPKSSSLFIEKLKKSKTPSKNNDVLRGRSTTNHDSLLNTKISIFKSFKTEKKKMRKIIIFLWP